MTETAPITRWSGEYNWWHRIEGLRALGLSWPLINDAVMSRPVEWDASEVERIMGAQRV